MERFALQRGEKIIERTDSVIRPSNEVTWRETLVYCLVRAGSAAF